VKLVTIIIGFVAVSCSTIVCADGYKNIADAAYCVGSLRKQDEMTKMLLMGNTDFEVAARRKADLKLLEGQIFVESAIKQGTLFEAIASRMINEGYADADLCTQMNSKCTVEHIKRLQDNVDRAESEAEFDDCTRPIMPSCNRTRKCDGE
jgi:hypothetical protein